MTEKILIRGPNWIGDAVLTLPAIEGLRELYREAEICLLVKPWVADIFSLTPSIDRIILYHKGYEGIRGMGRLVRDLRKEDFHKAILFQNAFEAALIVFLAGIPERVGYRRDMRGPLLTSPVKVTEDLKREHQVNYYFNLVRILDGRGMLKGPGKPRISVTGGEAVEFLRSLEVSEPVAGISPGASYGPAKRWFPERFALLGDSLVEEGISVLIFGAKGEEEVCNAVSRAMKRPHHNLCGRITLSQFISLLSLCNLFITNDSGPMHIASALDVPTVAIFGSTDPRLTGPLGERSVVVKKDLDCSPCFERRCPFGHYGCMANITVEEVRSEVERLKEWI